MAGYNDIIEDCKVRIECRTLKRPDQSHFSYLACGKTIDTLAHVEYLSGGGSVHPADNIEEGGLTRTIGANNSSYFAFFDGEVNII
jgi:hypothetical protein